MMFSQFAQIAEIMPKLEQFGDHIIKFTNDMAAKQEAILENQELIIRKLNELNTCINTYRTDED